MVTLPLNWFPGALNATYKASEPVLVNVTFALKISGALFPRTRYPEPVFTIVAVSLNIFPPTLCIYDAPFLVIKTGLLNVLPFNKRVSELAVTGVPKIVPPKTDVTPVAVTVPLLILPERKLALPGITNDNCFRLTVPVVKSSAPFTVKFELSVRESVALLIVRLLNY
jgi:hypothetical protein